MRTIHDDIYDNIVTSISIALEDVVEGGATVCWFDEVGFTSTDSFAPDSDL